MDVETAIPLLKKCVGIKFRDLFADLPVDLRTNKGTVGQLLLKHIGLELDSELTDFSDGELKTNKSDAHGNPRETMSITQISGQIDSLVRKNPLPFVESNLFKKIQRLVFLPVCKDAENREDWFFVSIHEVNLNTQSALKEMLENDYDSICSQLRNHILTSDDGYIHTSNGELIQVRSKDTKPYHPIHSEEFQRLISSKNHAFYFKEEFMNYVRRHL